MAIKWFNINSGEVRIAETPEHIAAMWASSDHSPNITQGQDFGWRLSPDTLIELKYLKQDEDELERIARRFRKSLEDLTEYDLLSWISLKSTPEDAPVARQSDYQDEYDQEVRRKDRERQKAEKERKAASTTAAE